MCLLSKPEVEHLFCGDIKSTRGLRHPLLLSSPANKRRPGWPSFSMSSSSSPQPSSPVAPGSATMPCSTSATLSSTPATSCGLLNLIILATVQLSAGLCRRALRARKNQRGVVEWGSKNCLHRAVVNRHKARRSLAFFVCSPEEKVIRPPPEAEFGRSRLYPDFTWSSLRHYRAEVRRLSSFVDWPKSSSP